MAGALSDRSLQATVFAPTDDAFALALAELDLSAEQVLAQPALLQKVRLQLGGGSGEGGLVGWVLEQGGQRQLGRRLTSSNSRPSLTLPSLLHTKPPPPQILKYHVVPAPLNSAQLKDGTKLTTLLAAELPAPEKAVVYVANHQSFLDIYSLFHLNRPFKFISKTSNFKIPIIGWSMFLTGVGCVCACVCVCVRERE